jgi:Rrf2 family transcriptional regulator, cysteine metabolism repressor
VKLSTRCRYGLRALADLTANSGKGPVALGQIAERQSLPLKYLEQDFAALRQAGLVRSIKGAQGGYLLARDPSRIRVGEVVRVLEGNLDFFAAQPGNGPGTAIRRCLAEAVWQPLNELIRSRLDSLSLTDLMGPAAAAGRPAEPVSDN